jgi:predicted phage-related endonuclease
MKISTKKLDDINKDRMNRIIQEEDSQMFLRKKLENNLKDEMMEQTKSFSKNYNSMDCYSEQTFKDGSEGIKRVCGSLYQPSANQDVKQLILCLEKDSFCG